MDLQYVSILKESAGENYLESIQSLKPLNEAIVLNVPSDETGNIYVNVFKDELGKENLEKVTIAY